jgi:cholesterol transport system auxiliary component
MSGSIIRREANLKNRFPTLPLLLALFLLSGCAATKAVTQTTYDLGIPAPVSLLAGDRAQTVVPATIPPITVADVTSASWLDSQAMYFRLRYENDQQPRPYAHSRWSMPPPQLFEQRLKARLAEAGGVVLSGADGAINIPLLRVDTADFSQRFASPQQSDVQVSVRASLMNGRILVAQKSFAQVRPAPSADAAGGVSALALATDAVIGDMMAWLAALPAKK